jgi:AcrR family transcriptional regulator
MAPGKSRPEGGGRSSGRGRRSAAEAARTRARVLRHAERLFAGKGYSATSLRDLSKASGVRMFTIQHHFGSKRGLYEEIVRQWDRDAEQLVRRVLAESPSSPSVVERVVKELFDFFLANRNRVALNARAALGEGLSRRVRQADRSWVRFMTSTMKAPRVGGARLDPGLLLITIEGILHNHTLASHHYRHLFGRDVTAPTVAARTKEHLARVIIALVGHDAAAARPRRAGSAVAGGSRHRRGRSGL